MTTAQAAELCDIPARTIQRWARQQRITSHVRGGKVYVDAVEVQELTERRHAGRLPRS